MEKVCARLMTSRTDGMMKFDQTEHARADRDQLRSLRSTSLVDLHDVYTHTHSNITGESHVLPGSTETDTKITQTIRGMREPRHRIHTVTWMTTERGKEETTDIQTQRYRHTDTHTCIHKGE